MEKVNVLISTYNGEKYITAQIDSILNQTYTNLRIYVRDDGSTDQTVSILKTYEKRNQIVLLEGENVGFGRSFMQLLQYAEDGDYWAFCDQDDIWDSHKLDKAVKQLKSMPDTEPNLYFHNFFLTDENMNITGTYRNCIPDYSFQMAITECLHMGFATVFNSRFRELMLKGDITQIPSHDWWAELIAMEFGNVYTDDYIGARHRRLDVSVSGNGLGSRIKWFFGALKGSSEIPELAKEFLHVFGNEMKLKDKEVLEWFVMERCSIKKILKKFFYGRRWRTSLTSELVLRFLMLAGKI
ncbi:MAG: glycosyltransferase family 2 protein [Lachnospiraceae bacterium]|nr:glycosyltransferase family 2 protein [Lachnospiraceae bacterium]